MVKNYLTALLTLFFVLGVTLDADAQRKSKKSKKNETEVPAPPKPKPKKGEPQPYAKVVTKDAKTDDGLFKVHTINDKYLFEIPDSLFNRELLLVSRIAKNTNNGGTFGGQKANTQVLRWQKKGNKVFLRMVSHNIVADEELPVHQAVVNSNFEPVLFTFDVEAYSTDKSAAVIDVTELF